MYTCFLTATGPWVEACNSGTGKDGRWIVPHKGEDGWRIPHAYATPLIYPDPPPPQPTIRDPLKACPRGQVL